MTFIDVLAWFFGSLSTLFFLVNFICFLSYSSSMTKRLDTLNRKERIFPMRKWLIISVICWAWLISKGVLI